MNASDDSRVTTLDETPLLTLLGVPVYVSGMPGHFVDAHNCRLVLHWRVGDFRVSTVGQRVRGEDEIITIAAGIWSETMVFRVSNFDWAPEGVVTDWAGVARVSVDGKFTRPAEALHYAVALSIARLIVKYPSGGPSDEDIQGELADL